MPVRSNRLNLVLVAVLVTVSGSCFTEGDAPRSIHPGAGADGRGSPGAAGAERIELAEGGVTVPGRDESTVDSDLYDAFDPDDRIVRIVEPDGSLFQGPVDVTFFDANGVIRRFEAERAFERPSGLLPQFIRIAPRDRATVDLYVGLDGAVEVVALERAAVDFAVEDELGRPVEGRRLRMRAVGLDRAGQLGRRGDDELQFLSIDRELSTAFERELGPQGSSRGRGSVLHRIAGRGGARLFVDGARLALAPDRPLRTGDDGRVRATGLPSGSHWSWTVEDTCRSISPTPLDEVRPGRGSSRLWSSSFLVESTRTAEYTAVVIARGRAVGRIELGRAARVVDATVTLVPRAASGETSARTLAERLVHGVQPVTTLPVQLEDLLPGPRELGLQLQLDDGRVIRLEASFDVVGGETTNLGVLRPVGGSLTVVVGARDLSGAPVDLRSVLDVERVPVRITQLSEAAELPDEAQLAEHEGFTIFDLIRAGGEAFEFDAVPGAQHYVDGIPDGPVVVGPLIDETDLSQGWGCLREFAYEVVDVPDGRLLEIDLTVHRAANLTVDLVAGSLEQRDSVGTLALVHETEGRVRVEEFDWFRSDESGRVHTFTVERVPLGAYRLVGRIDSIGYQEDVWGWNGRIETRKRSGFGVLVDSHFFLEEDGPSDVTVALRSGATLTGTLPAGHEAIASWIELRRLDPALSDAPGATVWTYVVPAPEEPLVPGVGGTWCAEGLLPFTSYRIGTGGREVTTAGEGSELVVELTDEDLGLVEDDR